MSDKRNARYAPYMFWKSVLRDIDKRLRGLTDADRSLRCQGNTSRRVGKATKEIEKELSRLTRLRVWATERIRKCTEPSGEPYWRVQVNLQKINSRIKALRDAQSKLSHYSLPSSNYRLECAETSVAEEASRLERVRHRFYRHMRRYEPLPEGWWDYV